MGELVARQGQYFIGYEYHETVDDGVTSDSVYIPPVDNFISVALIAGANTGKIQYTTSLSTDVIADNDDVVWYDWDTASTATTGTLHENLDYAITGVRCISLSGEVTFDIVS